MGGPVSVEPSLGGSAPGLRRWRLKRIGVVRLTNSNTGLSVPAAPPPPVQTPVFVDPCVPSPCGPYSECRDIGGAPSCSCRVGYTGSPPNCRPECVINSDCPSNRACMREKCRDPCPGSCGQGAQCAVLNHTPMCTCPAGYTGDPFSNCYPKPPERRLRVPLGVAWLLFCIFSGLWM